MKIHGIEVKPTALVRPHRHRAMTVAEMNASLRTAARLGEQFAEAFDKVAQAVSVTTAEMETLRLRLERALRRPIVVTMQDGVTREVLR